jgi:hypothetical protein
MVREFLASGPRSASGKVRRAITTWIIAALARVKIRATCGAHGISDATRIFDHEQIEDGKVVIVVVAQSATRTLAIPA